MVLNLLTGIVAKLGAAGVAAKAGVGLAVAAASMTGAAAAGILPETGPSAEEPAEELIVSDTPDEDLGDEAEDDGDAKPAEHDNFGASVSEDASDPADPGVDGREISEAARTMGSEHRPAEAGATGQSKAGATPAASHLPESVPGGPDTADGYRPESPATGGEAPEPPAGAPEEIPGAPEGLPDGAPDSAPSGPPADVPGGRR